jgi:hypothetical protein
LAARAVFGLLAVAPVRSEMATGFALPEGPAALFLLF